ncbi:restriction endonuclease subunit S [Listeria aquatica]|uniref:restriction endonuclease subunit S n=1 Tax=Listeria aquatica TaxID=1494960 RepID=UPI0031F4D60F
MDEVEWGEFTTNEIFDIQNTKPYHKSDLTESQNKGIPYVTRTSINNGLECLVLPDNNFLKCPKNVITFGAESVCFFSQPYEFITGNKMYYCIRKNSTDLSIEQCIFLQIVFTNSLKGTEYGYGVGLTGTRFSNRKISLPLLDDKTPNWDYMEQYIVNIMKTIEVPELESIKSSGIDLHSVNWKEFSIKTISEIIQSGHDWESYNRITGTQPFIGSSAVNNGITGYVDSSNREKYVGKNVIGVNRNGSVGYAFYHPYRAYFSGDTRFIKIADFSDNIHVNLFITTMIMQQKDKYAYGYKMGTKRLSSQKIMLPVTNENIPHWQFMEDYIKSISNSHLL